MSEQGPQHELPFPPRGSIALTGLFVLAVFYTFYFARMFLLPLFLALFFNLLLSPLVRGLKKLKIPTALGAGMVVLALVAIFLSLLALLVEPATEWIERAPTSVMEVEQKLRQLKEPVEQVQRAAEEMEKLTQIGQEEPVEIEQESLFEVLFGGAQTLLLAGVLIVVLLYFLLASGDLFLRKLVQSLKKMADKKRAIEIARHLQKDISFYLLTITAINFSLGCAIWATMYALGLPNPLLWGVMAATLNYVPYVGAMVGTAVISLASAVTFDLAADIVLPPLLYLLITSTEGYFVTPMVLGRRLTLNPFVVLLGLIFWGWMWGIVGAILAVPLLVSVKIVCQHVPHFKTFGEFLGQ